MTNKAWFKIWLHERDEVMLSYDVERFREFYNKWTRRGIYQDGLLPDSDIVIEISMRKCVYNMAKSTEEQKKEAADWLHAHGCDTTI